MRSEPPRRSAPRILFVDNQVEDFVQYRMPLARTLRGAGFDVHVAVPREPGLEEISRQGFRVHVIYLKRLSVRPLDELRALASMIRLYRRLRPEIVHHFCLKPALYGGAASRLAHVPAAVSVLNGLGPVFTNPGLSMRILRRMIAGGLHFSFAHPNHRVIVQNPDDRENLIAQGIVPGERALVIGGSGVDLSRFTPRPEPDGPPVVLMASRLLWEKGVREFVAAAQGLRSGGSRARFLLLGEPDHGHPSAVPLSAIESWRDAGHIEWLGWRRDMPSLMAQSHVVCLPSYYGEGIPRVLLEAAASGRPIVAADSPGCREVVRHKVNGLLVPVRSAEALMDAISRLVEDAPLRAAMGRRGREIAVARFSLDKVNDANLAIHRSLLAATPARRLPH